jgi:hypothetical protein
MDLREIDERAQYSNTPILPKVESCKFRPRFDMPVIVGRENLQPFPCPIRLAKLKVF